MEREPHPGRFREKLIAAERGTLTMRLCPLCSLICCAGVLGAAASCATDDLNENIEPEGGADASSTPDQYAPQDAPTSRDAGRPDSPVIVLDGSGTDTGPGPDSALPDGGPCGAIGSPCNTDSPFGCPFFFMCAAAFPDAGASDAGADADPGPPMDGVCVPFSIPPDCNNGVDHCPLPDGGASDAGGPMCLLAAQRCLSPLEVSCICADAATASACGPP